MASFKRKCQMCDGEGTTIVETEAFDCLKCNGTGYHLKPVSLPVNIRVDNRLPQEFVMTVTHDGQLSFRKKGSRKPVTTSVQSAFNKAQAETAAMAIKARQEASGKRKRAHRVSRGLLGAGR